MRRSALVLVLPVVLGACFEDSLGSTGEATPTLVAVAPDDFLGDVPCTAAAGGMQAYVATLSEVSGDLDGAGEFALPSSAPQPCARTIAFGFVVPGLQYVADLDGYDRADLTPLAPGSRVLIDPAGQPVAPRWTTSCGRGGDREDATLSLPNRTVRVTRCDPLRAEGAPTTGGLAVDLGPLAACGGAPAFPRFTVAPRGGPAREASCGERLEWTALEAGRPVTFDVLAFAVGGAEPVAGTTCTGVPRAGTVVDTPCDPLATRGGLTIDVPALLAASGSSCDAAGLASASATVTTARGHVPLGPSAECRRLDARDLPGGVATATVVLQLAGGALAATTCEALVTPGATALARCLPVRLP
ncbi:MAG: hypothetical protein IT376_17385 [Polyangiaceae bacterium]|nr:hypothetical protein [Polyangiaceae bacterium]